MSKEVTRYDLRVTNDGAGLYATDEPNTRGMQYVRALDYDALLAERDAYKKALEKLARVPGCGCSFPCRCGGEEWTRAELEGRMDYAAETLTRAALQGEQP